jgi:hypothetical protein
MIEAATLHGHGPHHQQQAEIPVPPQFPLAMPWIVYPFCVAVAKSIMDSRLPLTLAPLPHLLIIPTCNFASFEACVPSEADLRCGRRV